MPRTVPSFPVSTPGPPHGAAQALAGLPSARASALPALWRADQLACAATPGAVARPTGFAALDAELPGGGWPAAGLTELLLAAPGSGELRLLSPWLGRGLDPAGQVLCIAPPFMPYAPALHALGWPLERLLLVRPESLADAAWAAEQGLRSGACAAVLWWQGQERAGPPQGRIPEGEARRYPSERAAAATLATALRRLHLAAQEGACPLFALRPASAQAQSSPAPLRLALAPAALGQLALTVFKRRGPAMTQALQLMLPASGCFAPKTPAASAPQGGVARLGRPGAGAAPKTPAASAPQGGVARLGRPGEGLPARRTLRRVQAAAGPGVVGSTLSEPGDAVVRAAPERIAA